MMKKMMTTVKMVMLRVIVTVMLLMYQALF